MINTLGDFVRFIATVGGGGLLCYPLKYSSGQHFILNAM
jgi:hypothetical protein